MLFSNTNPDTFHMTWGSKYDTDYIQMQTFSVRTHRQTRTEGHDIISVYNIGFYRDRVT